MFHIRDFQITAREKFLELFHTEWLSNPDVKHLKSFFALHGIRMTHATQNNMLLFNFKYGQTCVFDTEWKYACRGTTLGYNGKWSFSVFGLPKFFNEGEISKQMGMEFLPMLRDIESDGYQLVFMNKEDGSNIRFWYDETGYLHAYTLGTVTEHKMQPNLPDSPTFTQLSIRYLKQHFPKLDVYLKEHPGVVFFAEILSKWNHIVTTYDFGEDEGTLKPIVMIGLDGVPTWSILQTLYPSFYEHDLPLYSKTTTAETYFKDRDAYFEWQASNPLLGTVPEGCVLYAVKKGECFPISKGKSDPYKKIHLGITLNVGTTADFMNAQKNEILGKYDDAIGELGHEQRDAHVATMIHAIRKLSVYLDEFIPDLIHYKNSPVEYADIVKSLSNPRRETKDLYLGWMSNFLFSHKYEIHDETDPTELIYQALASVNRGKCLLDELHSKNGLTWWTFTPKPEKVKFEKPVEPEPEVKCESPDPSCKVAVFDFDLTLVGESETFTANPQTVHALHTYNKLGATICILTGRDLTMKERIVGYLKTIISCPMEFYFREPGTSIFLHKAQTIQMLSTRFGSIYHFEDDSNVLNSCAGIVNSRGGKYMGHVITDGCVSHLITSQKTSLLITLVDAPGTGKTSVFHEIEKRVGNVTWVSPDKISNEYKRVMGEKIPPDIMYAKLKKQFKKGVASGGIVLIDTCNNKPEFIKDILSSGHNYILGTFMVTSEVKKKGKMVPVIDPSYLEFISTNVTQRIKDKHEGKVDAMNGSTLDCSTAVDIAIDKANGCLHQITSRNIKRFATTILSVNEKVNILMSEITSLLGQIDTTMIRAKLTQQDGTVISETTQFNEHFHRIGESVFI